MLMEHSIKEIENAENEKSRPLEVDRVYDKKPVSGVKKGKGKGKGFSSSGGGSGSSSSKKKKSNNKNDNAGKRKRGSEDKNGARKKRKKEEGAVEVSRKKSKKSGASEVSKVQPSNERGEKANGVGGLGGICLKLDEGVSIPKRPRDLVRRKKVELDARRKVQEGTLGGDVSVVVGLAKVVENGNGKVRHYGNGNGKEVENEESEAASSGGVVEKVKRKKSGDRKENRSGRSGLLQHLKRELSHSPVQSDAPLTKKSQRSRKKAKAAGAVSVTKATSTKRAVDDSRGTSDGSLDDEQNLEENAARMLSSRFDPSCSGFTLGSDSKHSSSNGFPASSSHKNAGIAQPYTKAESDVVSSDAEARVLRPRDQSKKKVSSGERRYFYEVLSREMDSYWVLNRRIMVFWPLDKSWYIGHVIAYDPDKKLHHVKYDDRDEEWINLQNERFKLLLLPSEVPDKVGKKKPGNNGTHAGGSNYAKNDMESEPIISWLARSSHQKSPPLGIRKKRKSPGELCQSASSAFSESKVDPRGGLEVGSSGRNVDEAVLASALPVKSDSVKRKSGLENLIPSTCKPIVYFRRRFRKKQPVDALCELLPKSNKPLFSVVEPVEYSDFGFDLLYSVCYSGHSSRALKPDEYIWNVDDSGFWNLTVAVTSLKVFRVDLCFRLPSLINNLFQWHDYKAMNERGTLASKWPIVHLEILFVDNVVGLQFVLFEGCLKQVVLFVSVILAVFRQSTNEGKLVESKLPVTSIRFCFSCIQDRRKRLVFAIYNFTELANVKWLYLDRKLRRHCSLTKLLPPSECTYDNIKALRNGCNRLPLASVAVKRSSAASLLKGSNWTRITPTQSGCVMLSKLSCDSEKKNGKLPPFALSFAAAPTFFLSLHLKLLMERSIPSSSFLEQDPEALVEHSDEDCGLVGADLPVGGQPVRSPVSVGRVLEELPKGTSELDPESSISSAKVAHEVGISPFCDSQRCPKKKADFESESEKAQPSHPEHYLRSQQSLAAGDPFLPVCATGSAVCDPSCGMAVNNLSCHPGQRDACDIVLNNQHPVISDVDIGLTVVHNANPQVYCQDRVGCSSSYAAMNLSPTWSDGKQDILRNSFGNGPKKPRTQVSYSLPFGGHDHSSKNKLHHTKGFSHKRIRRASEKKTLETLGISQRNTHVMSCDANVLVTAGDRGWRQCGAKVVLELVDQSEWRLAIKLSGDTKYSYKAHQFLQTGSTNRYTHALMWKGGKDWILEFPDRSQWIVFREMYEECYTRNLRATSVKNIPIPGVRLIEEADECIPEVPFVRPPSKYYRQFENDIDIAMDPSRVLYDMDSDDERWVSKHQGLDFDGIACANIIIDMFEKTIDVFEKFAYAKQCDYFSVDELEDVLEDCWPLEAIKRIHEYWQEKRLKKGRPLIRHLQPPLWVKYKQQVKEWEQTVMKRNGILPNGCQDKVTTIEKPPMYAFCLKPRGLEVPNKGSKQRSQKKLPIGAIGNAVSGDSDAFQSGGQRLNGFAVADERVVYSTYNQGMSDSSPVLQGSARVFSPREAGGVGYFSLSSDGFERSHYSKPHRSKAKRLSFIPSTTDQPGMISFSQKAMKRNMAHGCSMGPSEWQNPAYYQADVFQRPHFEQLDPSELDEFRLRDAASAARHAVTIARMKRENAERMLCRADLAMHKAVTAIVTAEAVSAAYEEPENDL